MKSRYTWRCHTCDASNSAEANACASCGFPANATGKQIVAARALNGPAANALKSSVDASKPSITELLSPLTLWRKVIAVSGMALMLGGLLWLKVTFSFIEAAMSVGASAAGLLLLALAYAGAKLPSLNPSTGVVPRSTNSTKETALPQNDA
jgi:hypothetical protein